MTFGIKGYTKELDGMPYTLVEQGMNISNKFIDSEYHYINILSSGLTNSAYLTIGFIDDPSDRSLFIEAEDYDGKLLYRNLIDTTIQWGYVASIDNVNVAVTMIKDGTLYYPQIRIINDKGQIVKTIQCNNGTTEANIKLGSLIKCDGKIMYVYPVDSNHVLVDINPDTYEAAEEKKQIVATTGHSAAFFYDTINNVLWTDYKYLKSGRKYEYVYPITSLSELSYEVASKKKVVRETINANASFALYEKDKLLVTYANKKYLYTYSTSRLVATTETVNKNDILDNDSKLIFSEDIMKGTTPVGRKIYFALKGGSYDIELFNNEDKTLYVGGNGLDIKGIIHSSSDEVVSAKVTFNNLSKNFDVKTNEEFCIHLGPEFLKEGYYDDIYVEVGLSGNGGTLFGEIPNGSRINYDGTFYDKVSDTLIVEQNPSYFVRTDATAYDSMNKSNLLTEDEYNKYKEYITAIDRMNFWLQNDKKSYYGMIFETKKVGYSYLIYKKSVNLNEKFSYNKADDTYYNYISGGSKAAWKTDVWVSYAPCKDPIVSISESSFTNKNVTMNIHFDGECADLITNVHVIRENLDGVNEEDLEFDFSKQSSYDYTFDSSGIYQVTVVAESSYGNKSNLVIKTFKIDKEGPRLTDVSYENVNENAIGLLFGKDKETIAHVILEDLSGIKDTKQIDKYLYQLDVNVTSKKPLTFDVCDIVGNSSSINLDNNFLVDDIEPILQKPEVAYNKDRAEITLRAFDTESGLEGIYYKIGNEDEKKYDKTFSMMRDKYGQHNDVVIYAKDIAGNKSETVTIDINLNDSPLINIDEEYYNVTLDKLGVIEIASSDSDKDDVTLSVYYDEELLCSGINNLKLNLNLYEDVIRNFEYNRQYKLKIVASDMMDAETKYIYITKKNMEPAYKVSTKNVNFSNYAEVDISIYDLDDGTFGTSTCIINSNGVELGTYNLNPGDNTIKINNACLFGMHEINFNLINKNYKTSITRKINFCNLEEIDEENIFIKISNLYTNDFYNYALKRNNVFFYTENADRFLNDDLNVQTSNLTDAKNYVSNGIPVIICDEKISDNDLLSLLDNEGTDTILCYETGSTINVDPVIFSDYEEDYYYDDRGKNRKLNVNYDNLTFENTTNKYKYLIYDPFNNLTENKETKKEVKFEKDKFDFVIGDSGLYSLSISEWDEIKNGTIDYSKESDDKTISFYAHKKPTCKLTYEELETNGDSVKLRFYKEAKDDDYLSINNGIWKEKVYVETYSFDGNLLDEYIIDDNSKSFDLEINKNQITKTKYVVWDFGLSPSDNRFSFSSFDEVVINKINTDPFADFEYYVGDVNSNGYIYRMQNHEKIKFKNTSDYNDILATSGERKEEYEHDYDEFGQMIDNDEELYNKITITNKFGKNDTSISKKLNVYDIDLINISNLDEVEKGSSTLCFDILNAKNKSELYLMHENAKFFFDGDAYRANVFGTSEEEMTIKLEVYSNRDNSFLGEKEFKIKFVQNSEVLDFEIININDPWCEASVPVSVPEMPAGIIRKGYSFDFKITTRGLCNEGDYIYIIPKYFYLNNEGIKPCEIVSYKKGLVRPYELNILNEGKHIGNLNYLYLDYDDMFMNNNEEYYVGKFYLPSDCRAKVGDEIKNDGLILVNFEIVGASSSGFSFNYNKNKWIILNKSPYNIHGDAAIFSLKYDALGDYKNYLKY